jgi:hypothetical protein
MKATEMSQAERNGVAYFGGCPHCAGNDGHINVGRSHWMSCAEHKVKWCVGENLFSHWRDQTEDEQRKVYDDLGFGEYREIECEKAHTHPLVRQWMQESGFYDGGEYDDH